MPDVPRKLPDDPAFRSVKAEWFEGSEQPADVPIPLPDGARVYVRDNGAGKTQLVVRFNTGAVQVLATEP